MVPCDVELFLLREKLKKNYPSFRSEIVDKYGLLLRKESTATSGQKDIDLLFTAIIHGNEIGGIKVFSKLLDEILTGKIECNLNIAFLLGNVDAAKVGERFLQRDLNRSFGMKNSTQLFALEEKRAREIEPVLKRARFVVDIHQTTVPTLTPFFIFEENNPLQIEFARKIASDIPIVVFNDDFSDESGVGVDEFVGSTGGVGVVLEIGEKGFDESAISLGVSALKTALKVVDENSFSKTEKGSKIYKFIHVGRFNERVKLVDGLVNFKDVSSGDLLGTKQSGEEIFAPCSGKILFPKYPPYDQASEKFRIIKEF